MTDGSDRTTEALAALSSGVLPSVLRPYLPLTLSTEVVAGAVGESVWGVYEQTRKGTFPLTPLRLGRKLRWRTSELLALLGVEAGGES